MNFEKISGSKAVFVDCFNTVLIRKTSPDEVIFEFCKLLGDRYDTEPAFLYNHFVKIKKRLLLENFVRTGEAEQSFMAKDGIADRFAADICLNCQEKISQFKKDCCDLYIQAETQNLAANAQLVEVLRKRKQKGLKNYLVSDFYCEKEMIEKILQHFSILDVFDDLFISCEHNASKRTKKLYKKVLKSLNISPSDVVMIGDNKRVDCSNAKRCKMDAVKLDVKPIRCEKNFKKRTKYAYNYDKFLSIQKCCPEFNYSNFAFPLYLFIKRLHAQLVQKGVKDVFFLAREGQFLMKLYQIYCENLDEKRALSKGNVSQEQQPKAHYLLVSRNSTLMASLKPLKEEKFNLIFRGAPFVTMRKFLKTLGFKKEEINKIEKEIGENFDVRHHNLRETSVFKKLLNNKTFCNLYEQKRTSSNKAFGAYLSTFDVDFVHDGMTVVDVGWNGTIQDLISNYFGSSVNVYGYYVGACDRSKQDQARKCGLLYSRKSKKFRGHKMFRHNMFHYEQLLRANHNCVMDYVIKDGKGQAVLDTEVDDEANYHELIEPMQQRITEKFSQICKLDHTNNSAIEGIVLDQFYKMITHPTKQDAQWMFDCEFTHYNNFARIGYPIRSFAKVKKVLFNKLSNLGFQMKFAILPKKKKAK